MARTATITRTRMCRSIAVITVALLPVAVKPIAASGTSTARMQRPRAAALTDQQIHRALNPSPRIHVLPPVDTARSIRDALDIRRAASPNPAAVNNLVYLGGPVMQASNNSIPIFWMPATLQDGTPAAPDPNYINLMQRYFSDVGGSGLYETNAQYYQTVNGPTEYITNSSGLVQAIIDTNPYPAASSACAGSGPNCIEDGQIRVEMAAVISAHSLPLDLKTEYYVYTAPHESSCVAVDDCFKADINPSAAHGFTFCAYHSFSNINGAGFVYANMPYGGTASGNRCTGKTTFPNNRDADIVISTTSHEQMETTTDPIILGWIDATGAENGDKCSYNYGPLNFDGGLANEQWNGHYYLVQQEWDNASSSCVQGSPIGLPPSAPSIAATSSGDGWIDIAVNPPSSPGANPVSSYSVTAQPGGVTATVQLPGERLLLQGLANATTYSLTATASNSKGPGAPSATVTATPTNATRSFATTWNTTDYARLTKSAAYIGATPANTQLTAVYAIAYLTNIATVSGPTPLTPQFSTGPTTVTTQYSSADQPPLESVMQQYALSPTEAQYFAAQLLGYLLALGGH